MTELKLALGGETVITGSDGASYRVGPVTVEVIEGMQDWLCREALEQVAKACGNRSEAVTAIVAASAAGTFSFFGDKMFLRLMLPDGMKQLLYLKIAQNHRDVPKKVVSDFVDKNYGPLLEQNRMEQELAEKIRPNAEAPATTGANTTNPDGGTRS